MSYINRNSGQARSGAWIAVAALHGVALYALINGLGIDYVKETIVNLPARNFETPPPPTPEPVPQPPRTEPRDQVVDTVSPIVPVAPTKKTYEVELPPFIPVPPIDPPTIPDPGPTAQTPKFKPIGAAPRTSPGSWVSTNDYPTRDIRQGNEGTAVFRLSIDAAGKVTGCQVTRSSGHPGLDQATCSKVSDRARFEPARDENGQRRPGTYNGSITWVIPE